MALICTVHTDNEKSLIEFAIGHIFFITNFIVTYDYFILNLFLNIYNSIKIKFSKQSVIISCN